MIIKDLVNSHNLYKESSLFGRYISLEKITPLIASLDSLAEISVLGYSENEQPIHLLKIGTGSKKLLFWSQMHGNESTTTKALFDLLNFLKDSNNILVQSIIKNCTLYIIPMLNPDGALAYTRVNFNKEDLNRDAQLLTQKESRLFKSVVDKVKPLVAFNLHGQRTIFSAGNTNKSAIVSFLSPASNEKRTITESRKLGMRIVAEMNRLLQQFIPNCVGRYDDGFNINCTGDTLENNSITTILFEAGHNPNDYDREYTRKWIYGSLLSALDFIASDKLTTVGYEDYFKIPENGTCFKDIIIRNVIKKEGEFDISIQYEEQLKEGKLFFVPKIVDIRHQILDYGHVEFDFLIDKVKFYNDVENIKIGDILDEITIDNEIFSVFPLKK